MKPRSQRMARKGRVEPAEAHRIVQRKIKEEYPELEGPGGECIPCLSKEMEMEELSAGSRKNRIKKGR